jgi:DNA-binding transcriptional ArsR family regulator
MRALAHPTRLALLDHLHAVEQATATECAEFVDESPSSCSYHLRALAKWGFVEEGRGGAGRERPWRATAARIEFPSDGHEATVLRDEVVARQQQRVRDSLRNEHELPSAWRRAARTVSFLPASSTTSPESASTRSATALKPFMRSASNGIRQPSLVLLSGILL